MESELKELKKKYEKEKLRAQWCSERLREHLSIYTSKDYLGGHASVHELKVAHQELQKELDRQLSFSPDNLPLLFRLPLKGIIKLYTGGFGALRGAVAHKRSHWSYLEKTTKTDELSGESV